MTGDNAKGAVIMSVSMAAFVLNDACMKLVGPGLGLFQSIFLRGLLIVGIMGAAAWLAGAFRRLPARRDWQLIALRTAAEVVASLCFLTVLFHMPLANATAILQTLPLAMAVAGALFLSEPIGRRRILAILAGLLGVILVVRPGVGGFNGYVFLALLTVGCVTLRDLCVRRMSGSVPSLLVAFVTSVAVCGSGAVGLLLSETWVPVDAGQWSMLLRAALFLVVGYYCSVTAMRWGAVAVVGTFRYSVLVWASLLGWWLFGEAPDAVAMAGMAIIAGAGWFTIRRQRSARPAAPSAG